MSQITDGRPRVLRAFVQDASVRNHTFFSSSDGNFTQVKGEAEARAAMPGANVIAYEQPPLEKLRDPLTGRLPTDPPSPQSARVAPDIPGDVAAAHPLAGLPLPIEAVQAAHRPREPGEDDNDPPDDDQDASTAKDDQQAEISNLVHDLAKSMARLAISVAKDGIPKLKPGTGSDVRPTTKPRVATGGSKPTTTPPAKPYRATAEDIAEARRNGAGKAVDEANARVTDGVDQLKEAGFDVPLHYVWDPISSRYRIM
jgi:hypothetical protein